MCDLPNKLNPILTRHANMISTAENNAVRKYIVVQTAGITAKGELERYIKSPRGKIATVFTDMHTVMKLLRIKGAIIINLERK